MHFAHNCRGGVANICPQLDGYSAMAAYNPRVFQRLSR